MSKDSKPLLIFFTVLFLLPSSLTQQNQQQFIFNGFSNSNLTLKGVAEIQPDGILKLTNDTARLIGHAFFPYPLPFNNNNSFSTAFAFAIAPQYATLGGHGFAFLLSPDPELTGAQPSQFLGFLNASDNSNSTNHILAVEFDTVKDSEFFDISANHVGVDLNSLRSNASANASYFDDDADGQQRALKLMSGATIQAWVDYDHDRKLINVTISPSSTKPSRPLISYPLDLSSILLEDRMYVGFSASTGLLASSHYLIGWSFSLNGVAQSLDLPSLPKPKKNSTALICAVSASAFILLIAAIAYLFYKIKINADDDDVIEQWELEYDPRRFSYKELERATKGFSEGELLGRGVWGNVYKGTLPGSRSEVAVKQLACELRHTLREYMAELASIGRLRHRNIVRLKGWCRHRNYLLLVYEYMPNGSLDKFIFADEKSSCGVLSWEQRYRIIKGVASALLYLHEQWEHVVIHRDVKASNVMLDAELNGRLGGFGLAKLYEHGANPSTTRIAGTIGYMAPELILSGKVTTSSDVFAFGALVLEIVCGRRSIDRMAASKKLVDWVRNTWSSGSDSGRWVEVVDPRLEGGFDVEEARVAVKVGLICSHRERGMRPSMREVLRYLDGRDATQVPEVREEPRGEYEDFLQSYPSSSSEKIEEGGVNVGDTLFGSSM